MQFRIDAHRNTPLYWEAHCAAFLNRENEIRPARNAQEQYAADRGREDGLALRERRVRELRAA